MSNVIFNIHIGDYIVAIPGQYAGPQCELPGEFKQRKEDTGIELASALGGSFLYATDAPD